MNTFKHRDTPSGKISATPIYPVNRPNLAATLRFEWSRHQFREWAQRVAGEAGYAVEFRGVGPEDPLLGPPTQMASFHRLEKEAETPPGPPVTNGMQPPPPGLLGE